MPTIEVHPDRFEALPGAMQVPPSTTLTFQRVQRTDSIKITLDPNLFTQGEVEIPIGQSSVDATVKPGALPGQYQDAYWTLKYDPQRDSPGTMTGNLDVVNDYQRGRTAS